MPRVCSWSACNKGVQSGVKELPMCPVNKTQKTLTSGNPEGVYLKKVIIYKNEANSGKCQGLRSSVMGGRMWPHSRLDLSCFTVHLFKENMRQAPDQQRPAGFRGYLVDQRRLPPRFSIFIHTWRGKENLNSRALAQRRWMHPKVRCQLEGILVLWTLK